jgi:hypothetical protein
MSSPAGEADGYPLSSPMATKWQVAAAQTKAWKTS